MDDRRIDEPAAPQPSPAELGVCQDAVIRGEPLSPEMPAEDPAGGPRRRCPAGRRVSKIVPPLVAPEREIDDQHPPRGMVEGRHVEAEISEEKVEITAQLSVLPGDR